MSSKKGGRGAAKLGVRGCRYAAKYTGGSFIKTDLAPSRLSCLAIMFVSAPVVSDYFFRMGLKNCLFGEAAPKGRIVGYQIGSSQVVVSPSLRFGVVGLKASENASRCFVGF